MSFYKKFEYGFIYLFEWIVLGVILGFFGSVIAIVFKHGLIFIEKLTLNLPVYIAPIIGGLIMGFVFYRINKNSMGFGTDKYIEGINHNNGVFDSELSVLKPLATLSTLGFYGSGGLVGPALLTGSSLSSVFIQTVKKLFKNSFIKWIDTRLVAITGASAAVGALFQAPLGGGFLAVEILKPSSIDYEELFPSIISSCMGYIFVTVLFNEQPVFAVHNYHFQTFHLVYLILTAILGGITGLIFVAIFKKLKVFYDEHEIRTELRPVSGSVLTVLMGLIFGRRVLGLGFETIQQTITGNCGIKESVSQYTGKILSTVLTVASGNSGGIVGPTLFIGSSIGSIMGNLCPVEPSALAVTGMAGVLSSICNVPLAATIIMSEIFGSSYTVPAVIGGVSGFIIGKPSVVYEYLNNPKLYNYSN